MTKKKVAPAREVKTTRAKAAAASSDLTVRNEASAAAEPAEAPKAASVGAAAPQRPPFRRPASFNFAGVGRNDICPCGSGKRFKNCHGH